MVALHGLEFDVGGGGGADQALQRLTVDDQGARRQPPLDFEVLQIAQQLGGQRGRVVHCVDSKRANPALAISPMRCRKSVPMSAL